MGEFLLYSDEAGDLGIDLSKSGCTKTYVPFILFVSPEFREPLYIAFRNSFKKITGISPKTWKKLPSRIKNDDDLLSSLIDDFEEEVSRLNPKRSLTHLFSACIVDKQEILPDQPLSQLRLYRMAWGYGLIFKRLGKYLANSGNRATWKIHQNASPEIRNLTAYINSEIPRIKDFRKNYTGPSFATPEEARYILLADFFAGLVRVVSEDVITNCDDCPDFEEDCQQECMALKYPRLANSLFAMFNVDIYQDEKVTWQWRGFLYHPMRARDKYDHIFPYDEFIR